MIKMRKSKARGYADHGWLKTYHSFSFANYYDPNFMGFSVLRVINEDFVAAGKGFATHGHKDMEIITYIISGQLEHKDSMGNGAIIKPLEVQRMSAGKGVTHSEFNPTTEEVHLLQIWILPDKKSYEPSYEQKSFTGKISDDLLLVASNKGREGSVSLHQDVDIYLCKSKNVGEKNYFVKDGRCLWLQIVKGEIDVNGQKLVNGDGCSVEKLREVKLQWNAGAEFLLFDMISS